MRGFVVLSSGVLINLFYITRITPLYPDQTTYRVDTSDGQYFCITKAEYGTILNHLSSKTSKLTKENLDNIHKFLNKDVVE